MEPSDERATGPADRNTPDERPTGPADQHGPDAGTGTVRWARDPAALWRRSSNRIVVLSPSSSEPLLLEGTGAAVFELLEAPASVDELARTFAEVTGSDREVIARDLEPFLEKLGAEGVLASRPAVG